MMSGVNLPESERPKGGQSSAPQSIYGRDYAEEIATFGVRLRELRRSRKMSLEELAARTGLSVGLLSQLERGIGNPSFMTLMRIADALHTQISHFFFENNEAGQVVRKNQRKHMYFPQPGLTIELLTPDLDRRLQVLWVRYEVGLRTEEGPFIHDGEECVCLVRGRLELHVGEMVVALSEGDSITFDCSVPHWYYNPGPEVAEILSAMTPPGF
jgi:transcriptional regulator with XRE-family HTH domain